MARKTEVPASAVRDWAFANPDQPQPGKRGRIHPKVKDAYHKANPTKRYVEAGPAQEKSVTVKVAGQDSRGRNIKRPKTVTHAEARIALGQSPSTRGPIPLTRLAEALAQS